MLMLTI